MEIIIRKNLRRYPSEGIVFEEASMTQQHFKDECDIDKILKKYQETGFLVDPMSPRRPIQFGDFSEVGDYQSALNRVIEIQEAFDELPSRIRQRFENDPQKLAEFLADPANAAEAAKLGLVSPDSVSQKSSESVPKNDVGTPLPEGGVDASSAQGNPVSGN